MTNFRRAIHVGHLSHDTLAVIMAGGNGHRLGELTRWHAKPALPFGGQYRNIDFTLSNCVNSGIRRIGLLTQYKAHSLIQHVHHGWSFLRPEMGEFIELWPAQQRLGESWYTGTADAVHQNIDLIQDHQPAYVLVLAGDHIYKMDYLAMIAEHVERGADATVGCVEVPIREAREFGVIGVDAGGWVREFSEKPVRPAHLPARPALALASMGIYVFNRDFLFECLITDAIDPDSSHDFGRNILPASIGKHRVHAHAFRYPRGSGQSYWRDVGTVDSYWHANMDLLTETPEIDLLDDQWPIWTHQVQCPPTRFEASGVATGSIVAAGCAVAGAVRHSLLFTNCKVGYKSRIEDSLVLPNARIGRRCWLKRAIVETGCVIPDNTVIGDDLLDDANRYYVSPNGVVLVTADMIEGITRMHMRREVA